ncbi:MAG TPA: DUF3857 domain-containing protein [Ferruginibacter sp.]|nr:DUF3857 domain-containing protein [Ferruginibacter sp.]HRO18301.1 DUF3857 domain-containing protein [Ferruginibacter sp.]HRQ21408.1 DUF3857 domain-containing protein [Ferruginibacter sp.]
MKYLMICLVLFATESKAQSYAAFFIPDSLRKNAVAVCRLEEKKVEIFSSSKAIVRNRYVITVLNPHGDGYGNYSNHYDKLRKLNNINGTLYDALGKKIKSMQKKDLLDMAYNDEISLMTDDRMKRFSFNHTSYPYTVEFTDEEQLNGTFFLPSWNPVPGQKFSVQHSSFEVVLHEGADVRFKELNVPEKPIEKVAGKQKSYVWTLKDFPAYEREWFQPAPENFLPNVYLAPVEFTIGNYTGKMDTWENLGKFILQLNAGKDALPPAIAADVKRLIGNVSNREEKIRLLYEYLQQNTRYISIQMGIGGWQPFDASYVATKRYGDCKALSNYMVSLLKEAGIKAHYVLINSGEARRGLWEDFPAPYFNHAVVCVPSGKDTLWLECTSQTISPGYMGSSTGNRKALMIADHGGVVVNSPLYTANENRQVRKIQAQVDESGNLKASLNTRFSGIEQETQHYLLHNNTAAMREKYLNQSLDLPNYSVEAIRYNETKSSIPEIEEYMELKATNYATITGKRMFITPNLVNKVSTRPDASKPRKYAVVYPHSFTHADTVEISVPAGYEPESIPKDVTVDNPFGKYSIRFEVKDNVIRMYRRYTREAATYPASSYADLAAFYHALYQADHSRVVLVKQSE